MIENFIKAGVGLTVAAGTSTIVGSVVKNATPENLSRVKKVTTTVASFAISGMAAAVVSEYAEKQVGTLFTTIRVGVKVGEQFVQNKKVVVVDKTDDEKNNEQKES